jgi:hypothetical protein
MRILFTSIVLVLVSQSSILGQDIQQQFLTDPMNVGKPISAGMGIEIEGNPYYKQDWSKGLAFVVKEGVAISLAKVKYNVLTEQLEFENSGKMMFLDNAIFSQFMLINGPDSILFRNKIEGIKSIPATSYVNVAFEGKNLWIIKPIKTLINDPDATYGSTKKKLIQSDEAFFLIKANKEVVSFKMTYRSITKSMGIDSKQFSDFLGSSGYSLEQPAYYKYIFAWLDGKL